MLAMTEPVKIGQHVAVARKRAGAQVGDLLRQTGHARVDMLLKYGEAAADDRAKESHRRLGPGDRL
jgi:hypothetical protein